MESDHQEDSSSTEETDRPEQDNNDVGTGRSYECAFCKRGFTTAQALGGHMNIHRKDRAKNRPPLDNPNKCEDIYVNPRTNNYQPISSQTQPCAAITEAKVSYRTYFPGSASAERPSYTHRGDEFCAQIPQRLSPFEDDWRMSLSLQFGPVGVEDKDREEKGGGSEDDELDLELRLGLNP